MRHNEAAHIFVYQLVEAVDSSRGDTVTAAKMAKLKELHGRLPVVDQAGTFERWCARLRFTLDAAGAGVSAGRSRLVQAAVAAADLSELAGKLAAVVKPDELGVRVNGATSAPAVKPE